uniref:Uncharacterized protein n=1 Tax=Arundo donax TaxID=35708 RepID=A0A0A9BD62_ARUDO
MGPFGQPDKEAATARARATADLHRKWKAGAP